MRKWERKKKGRLTPRHRKTKRKLKSWPFVVQKSTRNHENLAKVMQENQLKHKSPLQPFFLMSRNAPSNDACEGQH